MYTLLKIANIQLILVLMRFNMSDKIVHDKVNYVYEHM